MLHAKSILADEAVATVGSANLDMRSLFLDYEIALFFTGPHEIAFMEGWFERTMKDCLKGPPAAGKLGAGLESIARLLAPLI